MAYIIWHPTNWFLWKARKNRMYNNTNFDVEDIVEEIKVLSWHLTLNRIYIPACLYEWCWNPNDCLVRVARRSLEVAIGRWW